MENLENEVEEEKEEELSVDDKLDNFFTSYTVSSKYDVISFEFYLFTDSFVFRYYEFEGYELDFHYVKDSTENYLPKWDIDRFHNVQTENLIYYKVSSRLFDRHHRTMYMVKIDFHNENSPLTIREINQFLNLVKINYGIFLKGIGKGYNDGRILSIPEPYCSKVEITLDFKGYNVELIHENMVDNLYRLRSRKRESIIKDEQEKPFHTFDGRILFGHQATHYISNVYRDYLYNDNEGNAVYRFEMVLTKSYLRRKGIQTAEDIENFNKTLYWTDNYFFFRFDLDRIESYIKRTFPEDEAVRMNRFIAMAITSNDVISPIKIYEALKKYAVGGDRVFRYPSRQLLATKWHRFDTMIQNALSRLTLADKPFIKVVKTIERKRDKALAKRGRKSRWDDIVKAVESLKLKGIKPTYDAIEKEGNVSQKTIASYKERLRDLLNS